jgi:AraC-like DNA-binding protein
MRAVVSAASLEPMTVLTLDEDDGGERVVQILNDLGSARAARDLWELFAFHTMELSRHLERVVRDLLAAPEHHFDAEDVARTAGMSRRHLDRQLRGVGICSARRLVVAVRVAHAIDRIVRQQRSVTATSESLGYASRVVLSRHIKTVIGRVPTELGEGLASSEIRESLRRFIAALDVAAVSTAGDASIEA